MRAEYIVIMCVYVYINKVGGLLAHTHTPSGLLRIYATNNDAPIVICNRAATYKLYPRITRERAYLVGRMFVQPLLKYFH